MIFVSDYAECSNISLCPYVEMEKSLSLSGYQTLWWKLTGTRGNWLCRLWVKMQICVDIFAGVLTRIEQLGRRKEKQTATCDWTINSNHLNYWLQSRITLMKSRNFIYSRSGLHHSFLVSHWGNVYMQIWKLHDKCPAAFRCKHCMSKRRGGGGHAD